MGTKRDYYEILGTSRDADEDTIKKAIEDLPLNIIRIETLGINRLKRNSKKPQRPMRY